MVMKVIKNIYLQYFKWVVEMVKIDGVNILKIIIFCILLLDVIMLVSNFFVMLGDIFYEFDKSYYLLNRLVGIYYVYMYLKYKERVLFFFKLLLGIICVVVVIIVLGMGVNFFDVKYIVYVGLERFFVDYIQVVVRVGRNGEYVYDVVIYYGNQLVQCVVDVKEFVWIDGCICEVLFKNFSLNVYLV